MSMDSLPQELIARVKARCADPARRSGASSLAANSVSLESLLGNMPRNPDPQMQNHVEQLQGMLANAMSMFSKIAGDRGPTFGVCGPGVGEDGAQIVSFGGPAAPAEIRPCAEGDIAATEAELGFALPEPLRQLYAEIGDGNFGPGEGVYTLRRLVAKWREMTDEPTGPDGEEWPRALLPISGQDWDLVCLDRDSGRLIYFDCEELAEEEPDSWEKAFKPEADSLAAWLEQWLGEATPAEQIEEWNQELRRSRG